MQGNGEDGGAHLGRRQTAGRGWLDAAKRGLPNGGLDGSIGFHENGAPPAVLRQTSTSAALPLDL